MGQASPAMPGDIRLNRYAWNGVIAVAFLAICALFLNKIFTSDYGIHLSVGRYIVENGKIPHTEFWVYPWLNQPTSFKELGFQAIVYLVYKYSGSTGVSLFVWGMATLVWFFLYKALRSRGIRPYVILLSMLLFAFSFRIRLQPRPEIFAYLFSSFLIYGLSLFYYKDNRKIIWAFPFLFLLWANIHPSTLMGLGIVGVYGTQSLVIVAREKFDKAAMKRYLYIPLLVLALCAIATTISRHGVDSITTPLQIISNPTVKAFTSELVSIRDSSFYLPFKYMFAMVVLFGIPAVFLRYVKIHDVILAGYGFRLALQVARGMAFMSLFCVPLLAQSVEGILRKLEELIEEAWARSRGAAEARAIREAGGGKKARRKAAAGKGSAQEAPRSATPPRPSLLLTLRYGAFALFAFLTLIGSCYMYFKTIDVVEHGIGITRHKFSFQAAEFLRGLDIKGNMFNFFDVGGFLDWQLHPEKPTFIDGRGAETPQFLDHQIVTGAAPGIEDVFAKYNITYIVTKAADSSGMVLPLIQYLYVRPEWEVVFADGIMLVFMKNVPENRSIIDRYKVPKTVLADHVIRELIHYTYIGVNKPMVYSIVSRIYMEQRNREKADEYRKIAEEFATPPRFVQAIDAVLS